MPLFCPFKFTNIVSSYSWNRPCSAAHSAASAARHDSGPMNGKCLNRIFTRPLLTYSRIICCPGPRVKLAQAGHWKSPNSTRVTGASGSPINDPPETRVELSIVSLESFGDSVTNVIVEMAVMTIATPTISIQFFCT